MEDKIEHILLSQRAFFQTNITKQISFRKAQLQKLYNALKKHEKAIYDALWQDLNKSEYEAFLTEYSIVCSELNYAIKHLSSFAKPHRVKTPLSHMPGISFTQKEPYGIVLILSPWNYPFQLAMAPIIGAIASGNCVICKTSKNSLKTTDIIHKILSETFESSYVYSVNPQIEYDEILTQKYDYIFFTGSERVGKIIMRAASEYVTPLSLELGGKSPCIIEKSAHLKLAAKRILWGKLLNAGQTCVAPDYVLIPAHLKPTFIHYLETYKQKMFPDAVHNKDYPKIINTFHFKRLIGLLEREANKTVVSFDEHTQKIAPVFFTEATFDSEIMKEEIFGPILPIISYETLEDAVSEIKARPKPLACYIFSQNKASIKALLTELTFGGGCINDTVMHIANHHLPFGGVGTSGMGNYHGHYSLDTFSHEKAVLKSSVFVDVPLRYAPFNKKHLPLLHKILK